MKKLLSAFLIAGLSSVTAYATGSSSTPTSVGSGSSMGSSSQPTSKTKTSTLEKQEDTSADGSSSSYEKKESTTTEDSSQMMQDKSSTQGTGMGTEESLEKDKIDMSDEDHYEEE